MSGHQQDPSQESPLTRIAGGTAVAAGVLLGATQLGQLATIDRADIVATSADPLFRAFSIAYAGSFALLMVALVGLYVRQSRAAGTFGLFGFGAAVLGTMSLGADMWFEAFCSPWLVGSVPGMLTIEKAGIWQAGYLSSYVLFAVGWVLFGITCLRARVLPAAIAAGMVVGGAVGFLAAQPPFAVPLGLAVAAAGWWLHRADRASEPVPVPAQQG